MREMLRIDWTQCDGRGLATQLLPTVLGCDDWGYPLAKDAWPDVTSGQAWLNDAAGPEGAADAVCCR